MAEFELFQAFTLNITEGYNLINEINFPTIQNSYLVLMVNNNNFSTIGFEYETNKSDFLYFPDSGLLKNLDLKFNIQVNLLENELFENKLLISKSYSTFGVYNLNVYIQELNLNLTKIINVTKGFYLIFLLFKINYKL